MKDYIIINPKRLVAPASEIKGRCPVLTRIDVKVAVFSWVELKS